MFTKDELILIELVLSSEDILDLGDRALEFIKVNGDFYGEKITNYFEELERLDNYTYLLFDKVSEAIENSDESFTFTEVDLVVLNALFNSSESLEYNIRNNIDLPTQRIIDVEYIELTIGIDNMLDTIFEKVFNLVSEIVKEKNKVKVEEINEGS